MEYNFKRTKRQYGESFRTTDTISSELRGQMFADWIRNPLPEKKYDPNCAQNTRRVPKHPLSQMDLTLMK